MVAIRNTLIRYHREQQEGSPSSSPSSTIVAAATGLELYGGVGTIGLNVCDLLYSLVSSDENPHKKECFERSIIASSNSNDYNDDDPKYKYVPKNATDMITSMTTHASPFFIEEVSSSFQKDTCDSCSSGGSCTQRNQDGEYCKISVRYTEGSSWSAYEVRDQIYLGGPHNKSLYTKAFEAGDGKYLASGVVDENPEDAAAFSFPLQFGCQTRVTGLFKTQLVS